MSELESIFIVDDGGPRVILVIDLADFDVCFVIFGAQFNDSFEKLDAFPILAKTPLGLC